MIEIKVTIGPEAFEQGQYVYVWLDGSGKPFYVGETGKSPIDRAGLHIRDSSRSGAIVSEIIQRMNNPRQEYTVLAFLIPVELLNSVVAENKNAKGEATHNRARKALERKVYDVLVEDYPDIHKAKRCRWSAETGAQYAESILNECKNSAIRTA